MLVLAQKLAEAFHHDSLQFPLHAPQYLAYLDRLNLVLVQFVLAPPQFQLNQYFLVQGRKLKILNLRIEQYHHHATVFPAQYEYRLQTYHSMN
ncbi:Uncharacterised protein [Acinetobacter baumannii]|nr:Uncharacterised protein [Acinetobacter baumannii]